MKTLERVEVLTRPSEPNRWLLVLLVTLGSFAVGLVPIIYSSASADTQIRPIAGEAPIWSVLGEKADTSAGR